MKLIRRLVLLAARGLVGLFGHKWCRFAPREIKAHPGVLVKSGDVVVLGGVYVPATVMAWHRWIGDTGRLVVVEANPSNILKIKKAIGHFKNISFVSKAIWNNSCSLKFTVSKGDYQGWARVKDGVIGKYPKEYDKNSVEIDVEASTLDNILADSGVKKVDVIKLSINDAELQAVEGMTRVVRDNPNLKIVVDTRSPHPAAETTRKLKDVGMAVGISPFRKKIKRPDVTELVTIFACHK